MTAQITLQTNFNFNFSDRNNKKAVQILFYDYQKNISQFQWTES